MMNNKNITLVKMNPFEGAKFVNIDDTRFIYDTNFAGDPTKDKFRDDRRKVNIIIPDANMAADMDTAGVNVKVTKPREGEEAGFEPTFFVTALIGYKDDIDDPRNPKVYLVSGDAEPVLMNKNTIGILDDIRVKKVNTRLNIWHRDDGGVSLFVAIMYVEQWIEEDPWYRRYREDQNILV